jgi:hypothetical protein
MPKINLTMPEVAMCFYIAIEKYITYDLRYRDFTAMMHPFKSFCFDNYGIDLLEELKNFSEHDSTRDDFRRAIARAFDSEFDLERCILCLRDKGALRDYEYFVDRLKTFSGKPSFEKLNAHNKLRYENFKRTGSDKVPVKEEED